MFSNHKGFANILLIGIVALFLIGGVGYYFVSKEKKTSVFNQQENQEKNTIIEEISGANGLKAEVRIEGHQYSLVLIDNGIEKNIDYCFENPASSTRERGSEIGLDCSSFAKLEFSPGGSYLIYFLTNSTAPAQKFLYNIKTGKKVSVEDVVFSDAEDYFSSCVTNDAASIYSGVIYSGESLEKIYSVPSNDAEYLDCGKTIYDRKNNTFIFTFNNSASRDIEFNLDISKSRKLD